MKNIKSLLALFTIATILFSCKKEEAKIYYEGGTTPVLSSNKSANSNLSLQFANEKTAEAVKLMWTNPNYQFTTGLSSQNVKYTVEMDTLGSNFSSQNKKIFVFESDLAVSLTSFQINDAMLNQMSLIVGTNYNMQFRVKSELKGNSTTSQLYSNTLTFKAIPYAIPPKVDPPLSGELFLVGNASPGGWANPVPVPTQKFTQVNPLLYEITIPITGGNSYLILPVNGSWGDKYGFDGANNANNTDVDNFVRGGGDIKAPAVSGNYKIVLDFQRGRFTVTKL